jgi:penicillin-binding protein 2
MRIRILKSCIIFIFFVLILFILNLQVIQGKKFKALSDKNCIRLIPQIGSRGTILDRNNAVIVSDTISYDVMVLPRDVSQLEVAMGRLPRVLGISAEELKKRFKNAYLNPSLPVALVRNIEMKKAVILEELKADFPGVVVQPNPIRGYRYGKLACHVLGYLGEIDRWRLTRLSNYGYNTKDIVGFGGVEEKYDYYLRQEEGGVSAEVDHRGRFVRMLGYKPPRSGRNVQLTLDLKIQRIVEEALGERTGCAIIMDPYTGEIIAMVSNPGFDPTVFVARQNDKIAVLFTNPKAPLLNRAISGVYPAGSSFKPIVAAAALETGKENLSTTFVCSGATFVGRKEFKCWGVHGAQNIVGALAHSCNVFFYKTGVLVGGQNMYEYALKFGLSKPTSFELSNEASGFIPNPLWKKISRFQKWFDGDSANLSIGQGELLVTPLQMLRMIAVFANKGYLVTPFVVKAVDGKIVDDPLRKIVPIAIQESTINTVRRGLRGVTEEGGTASILNFPEITVAGKTGTAQNPRGAPHGWFVGFFPFEKPRYAIVVFLEHGVAGYMSSLTVKQIITQMLKEGLMSEGSLQNKESCLEK